MPCNDLGALCAEPPVGPTGSNAVLVLDGYLIVMGSLDGGKAGGPLHVFDVSDPRAPTRVTTVQSDATDRHRELHAIPVAVVDGHHYVALPTRPQGVNFWDFTDPTNPTLAGSIALSDRGGDYDNSVWQLTWTWPYLFASGTGDGVYVVDARDPHAPSLIGRIPTSLFGGARVGPVYAMGNFLVASNMDQAPMRVTVVDVTDPSAPFQLATATSDEPQYSSLVIGSRVFSLGKYGKYTFWSWNDESVDVVSKATFGTDKGGYCSYQDGFLFCGQSGEGFRKVDVRDLAHPQVVSTADIDRPSADIDFTTVLGNLVYLGNDHGTGSAFVPHQTSQDTTPPVMLEAFPASDATNVPLGSRLTVFFSDAIEMGSVDNDTFLVRDTTHCTTVDGGWSYSSFNAVSFGTKEPLAPDTTYEIVMRAGGIRDVAGNAISEPFTVRFSTGPTPSADACSADAAPPPADWDVTPKTDGDGGDFTPPLELALEPVVPARAGELVTYRVRSDGGSGVVSYRWTIGDCEGVPDRECTAPVESTSPEFSHVYARAGHHNVNVVATDESGAIRGSAAVQTIHHPLTDEPPSNSGTILYDASQRRVWNVNQDSGTVTATDVDAVRGSLEVPVGRSPRSIARAPDGTIWVVNQLSDSITILAPDTGSLVGTISLERASQPYAVAFGPRTGSAYVTLFASGKLIEIDSVARKVTREAALGPTPAGIAISHDSRIFVTRFISSVDRGEIWEVSSGSLELLRTIALPFDPGQADLGLEDPDSDSDGRGVPNYLFQMVISPDGREGWVMGKKDNTARGPQRDGRPMNPDSFVRAILCVVDLETSTELTHRRIDIDNRSLPVAAAFSPLGDYVYVLAQGSNFLGVYDAYHPSQHLGGIQNLGSAPDGLALLPDGRAFVNAALSRQLVVYDLSASIKFADHRFAEPLAVVPSTEEPLDPLVALGKRIFFDAADTRMSAHGYVTCASCHYDGLHDGRVWDFSDRGEGLRNTKSLVGAGGKGLGRLHWSANFDEVQDFERDIRESQGGKGFLSDAEWQAARESGPLGAPLIGLSPELDALAAYVDSLDRVGRSPFRNEDGTLTADALAGRELFQRAGCLQCHPGPDFTDSPRGVLHDVGTLLPSSGRRLNGPLTGLDTPTLKGVWQTAPYLHDGRALTLLEIFTKYNPHDRMGLTSDLDQAELSQLVRYLLELDAEPARETPAVSVAPPTTPTRPRDSCSAGWGRKSGGVSSALLVLLLVLGPVVQRRHRRERRQCFRSIN